MTTTGTYLHHGIRSEQQQQQAILPIQETNTRAVSNPSLTLTNSTTNSEFAYAFVIGGCNPDKPAYRGFVYDILVSAQILRSQGSTADIVAFFQLAYDYKGASVLPIQDSRPLKAMGIDIYYIPPSEKESFYETVLHKFRILTLTQYRRVLFLDGDVMPLGNLDFLFSLSTDNKYGPGNSTLKPNVVIAGKTEPANAGFFLLSPGKGEYNQVQEIIQKREAKAASLNGSFKFDEVEGWGHVMTNDWITRSTRRGRNWTFAFAYSDQGLLYHWVKHVKKQVSIVFEHNVENFSQDAHGNTVLEQRLQDPFYNYSKPILHSALDCKKYMCDFVHFTGNTKPWMKYTPEAFLNSSTEPTTPNELWWYTLKIINRNLNMGLDFFNWTYIGRPSFGLYASHQDLNERIARLSDTNQTRF